MFGVARSSREARKYLWGDITHGSGGNGRTSIMPMPLTFDDVQVDLGAIPDTLTESFDKRALDFLVSDRGKAVVQRVMDSYGELVHTHGTNDEASVDLVKQLETHMTILKTYRRKGPDPA